MMNPFERLISDLRTHFPEDREKWQRRKQQMTPGSAETPTLFWYLSSGMDTMALYYFGRETPGLKLPKADCFIFSDNGIVFTDPVSIKQRLDRGEPEPLPSKKGKFFLKQLIPLHFINKELEEKSTEIVLNLTAFRGAPVFFLEIQHDVEDAEAKCMSVLFMRRTNASVRDLLVRHDIKTDYICTVADGCRPANEDRCPNQYFKFYNAALKNNGIWITDHFNQKKPDALRPMGELENWGHYDLNDKSYCYSKKYV